MRYQGANRFLVFYNTGEPFHKIITQTRPWHLGPWTNPRIMKDTCYSFISGGKYCRLY